VKNSFIFVLCGKSIRTTQLSSKFLEERKGITYKKNWGFFKLKLFFCRGLTGRGRQMCDGFLNKQKFRVVARTAHHHHQKNGKF
jgi:hypothetical protein